MSRIFKNFLLFVFTAVMLALPAIYYINAARDRQSDEPKQVLTKYLKFLYARDFRHAYRFIASEDQRLKPQKDYVRERGPFNGFALEAARKLSGLIELKPVSEQPDGKAKRVRVAMKLPDANGVSGLLLDWDEKRLNALPAPAQKKILATIDDLMRQKKLPMIEGEEEFVLVQENAQWKVHLNWAAGVKVKFATILPPDGGILAEPIIKETVARSDDLFTIGFNVKTAPPANSSLASCTGSSRKRWRPISISLNAPCCCRCGFSRRRADLQQHLRSSRRLARWGQKPQCHL